MAPDGSEKESLMQSIDEHNKDDWELINDWNLSWIFGTDLDD